MPMQAQQMRQVRGAGTQTRYPVQVIEFARRLHEDGRRPTEIRHALFRLGYQPSLNTVLIWTKPEARESQAAHKRLWERKGHGDGPSVLMRRMRRLREAGLTYTAIAAVMNLDFGTQLTKESVRYLFNTGGARAVRKHLGEQR